MPGATFLIEELNLLGGVEPPGGFQRFEWDEAHQNIPLKPWTFGVEQRTVRTDYPGADDPTEQILGPNFSEFSVEGVWDDRYNAYEVSEDLRRTATAETIRGLSGGYAVAEWKRFELMVRRGNVVRITFEDVVIQGVITDFELQYFHQHRIGYKFTFSPHHRQPGGFFALKRSPRTVLNAQQLRDEVGEEVTEALALHELAPTTSLIGTIYADTDELVGEWVSKLAEIDTAISQRQLSPELEPTAALFRLAQQFYTMSVIGQQVLDLLSATDADEALSYMSGDKVLLYNVWARGLMYQGRRMVVTGRRAASELQQRAEPNAIALYRPQADEHLYSISNRFYRTKDSWRAIAKRNGLTTYKLTGDELLIIPEVTER